MAEPTRLGGSPVIADVRKRVDRRAGLADDDVRLDRLRDDADGLLRRLEQVRDTRWSELIPARFAAARIADLSGNLRSAADRWVSGGMAANVLLLGPVGVGKTHAAVALARAAFEAGQPIRMASTVELLEGLRPGGQIRWRPDTVQLLILDDLGVEKPTDWSGSTLDRIIDRRWKDGRPTIITSNLTPDVIAEQVGPRLWSRLYHDAVRHTVAGTDRRTA